MLDRYPPLLTENGPATLDDFPIDSEFNYSLFLIPTNREVIFSLRLKVHDPIVSRILWNEKLPETSEADKTAMYFEQESKTYNRPAGLGWSSPTFRISDVQLARFYVRNDKQAIISSLRFIMGTIEQQLLASTSTGEESFSFTSTKDVLDAIQKLIEAEKEELAAAGEGVETPLTVKLPTPTVGIPWLP